MTPKNLQKLCATWQKRLRIQDWDIELEITSLRRMHDLVGDEMLGGCNVHETKKRAQIIILDPAERRLEDADADSLEVVLVHELLHVVMPVQDLNIKVDKDSSVYTAYERIVDQMARTLVEAYSGDS